MELQEEKSPGIPASTSLDGAVSWLMAAIEKERSEKEWLAKKCDWLMTKYDDKCCEVRSLQVEVATVHSDLETAQALLKPPDKRQSVHDFLRSARPSIEKTQGDAAAGSGLHAARHFTATANADSSQLPSPSLPQQQSQAEPPPQKQVEGVAQSTDASPKGSCGNLRERRGLNLGGLNVESRKSNSNMCSPQTAASLPDSPPCEEPSKSSEGDSVDKPDKPDEAKKVQKDAQVDKTIILSSPPATKGGSIATDEALLAAVREVSPTMAREIMEMRAEPQSALLKRRKEDWGSGTGAKEESTSHNGTGIAKTLNVVSNKIFSMSQDDSELPCSPKRISRKSRKASMYETCPT